jgi:hypothetical protein
MRDEPLDEGEIKQMVSGKQIAVPTLMNHRSLGAMFCLLLRPSIFFAVQSTLALKIEASLKMENCRSGAPVRRLFGRYPGDSGDSVSMVWGFELLESERF